MLLKSVSGLLAFRLNLCQLDLGPYLFYEFNKWICDPCPIANSYYATMFYLLQNLGVAMKG